MSGETSQGPRARGRCQCGGVAYAIHGELRPVLNCHCHRCRKFTGHHMAATSAPTGAVEFESDATLRWYEPDDTVAYGFCTTCGSSLFWRATAHPDRLVICAGPLDQPTGLRTVGAWWMAEHGDYHTPEPGVEEHAYDG